MPANRNKDIGSWDMSLNGGMNETFNKRYISLKTKWYEYLKSWFDILYKICNFLGHENDGKLDKNVAGIM